jgi:hypothetical protein
LKISISGTVNKLQVRLQEALVTRTKRKRTPVAKVKF